MLVFLITVFLPLSGFAQKLELNVVEHTLKNGMKFLILERHEAPVFSTYLRFKVGSVNEHPGITGTSHLLEHMMFKGTQSMGTTNYKKEISLMEKIEKVMDQIDEAWAEGDEARIKALKEKLAKFQKEQKKYLVKNELWQTYMRNGGVGLNASTGNDGTQYYVSLPSNRLELWFFLESDRMKNPVLREFYSERDVVYEERRLRTDTQPRGKLWEQFGAAAFTAHPYGWPVVGWAADLETVRRSEVEAYFKAYYAPNNSIAVIVGDVDPEEVIRLAEKYFGKILSQPPPPPVQTREPEQKGERRVIVEFDANPSLLIGYHKPELTHPDQYVFDVIGDILSSGRTSRLYENIVKKKKLATRVRGFGGGQQFPNLFIFSATPRHPHTTLEVEEAIYEEIERLKKEPVSNWELEKVRNQADANFIRGLQTNFGMASRLGHYEVLTGSWRYLVDVIDKRKAVTTEEIMRVAQETFTPSNRTVASLVKKEKSNYSWPDSQALESMKGE
ncbi:insulinase family protein [candidate division TA06 bacterium]|nr:insulinase family protein [candidate division TA06 bacterium]